MSLDEPIGFGVACRTHRLLESTLHSRGWKGPKASSRRSPFCLDDDRNVFTQTKKHKKFTAVIGKDAVITLVPARVTMVP